jgi:zinc transport system substrate-binding protein
MRKQIKLLIAATLLLVGCNNAKPPKADMVVSIEPLKYIVESIVGDDFTIEVLVPSGTSPETYEPTPRQMSEISDAKMIFSTGLIDFECNLLGKIAVPERVINLSEGIVLIKGECSHCGHDHSPAHGHAHGTDPHIWTSPDELRIMARNAHDAIMQQYPDSAKYHIAYQQLDHKIEALSEHCRTKIATSQTKAFVIYHPALSYYARNYNIEQVAIENQGKEPSAKHIAKIIDLARQNDIHCLLYQAEFPRSVVDVIARDMGVEPTQINPLEANPLLFIENVTHIITQK